MTDISDNNTESDRFSEAERDLLLRRLQRSAERLYTRSRLARVLSPLTWVGVFLCSRPGFQTFFDHHLFKIAPAEGNHYLSGRLVIYALLANLLLHLGWSIADFVTRRRLKAQIAMLKNDVRAVGPLAQLSHGKDFAVADRAQEALCLLMPQMRAGDGRHLSDKQMQALLDLLNPDRVHLSRVDQLPGAILQALTECGDSRALKTVRRLATSPFDNWWQQEAEACLRVLEQEGEQRTYEHSLLVPTAGENGAQALLRPTASQPPPQPEQLLRAANEGAKR